jgi:hypothetical protein
MQKLSPSQAITFEDASFPLVEVCFRDGHTNADWAWMLQQFEELFAGQRRYTLLLDSSRLSHAPSAQARRDIADWQNAHAANTARWCLGASIYISSSMIRGALTAMNWLAPQVVPFDYPSSLADGLDQCVTRLDEAFLVVPTALRRRQVAMLGGSSDGAGAAGRESRRPGA